MIEILKRLSRKDRSPRRVLDKEPAETVKNVCKLLFIDYIIINKKRAVINKKRTVRNKKKGCYK